MRSTPSKPRLIALPAADQLASCVPLTALAYVSSTDYNFAIAFNGVVFLIASVAGQVTLSRHYAPLIARNPRHRLGRRAWLVLYVFVAVQLAFVDDRVGGVALFILVAISHRRHRGESHASQNSHPVARVHCPSPVR